MIRTVLGCLVLCMVVAFSYAGDAEDGFWDSVVKSNQKEEYEIYLQKYPKGRYAGAARRIIEGMREKPGAETEADKQKQAREQAAKRVAERAKRREEVEAQRRRAEAEVERQRAEREAEQRRADADAARLRVEQEALRPGRVFRDCADCPEMVVIPAGSFEMGSTDGNAGERPVHTVRIGRPFAMARTEVTQAQWRAVMGGNPSRFGGCDDCPVENVSWNDAQDFARRLSQKTGRTYHLPSEAEWEYACRAGGRQEYCGSDHVDAVAWFWSNSGGKTRPVGSKQANAWGLHDMSGNVWEWVEDCGNDSYDGAPADGGAWRRGDCSARALRGGSWNGRPWGVRAAARGWVVTSSRNYIIGFRPARMLP